jgi:hypothetical protein
LKIEQVEKILFGKLKTSRSCLKTRLNKEFVYSTTKMEGDKEAAQSTKKLNSRVPKLERQIGALKVKFDILNNSITQKLVKPLVMCIFSKKD